jgi:hypothetical protein
MRIVRFVFVIIVSVPFLAASFAQQTPTSNAQAVKFLQQALAALNPGIPTTDVTLSGSVHYVAGSEDENGTATLQALAGASKLNLSLPSGSRTYVENASGNSPSGTWSGPDGVAHAIAFHNLLTDPVWFFPLLPISQGLSNSGYVITYVGQETLDGEAVQHITVFQSASFQTSDGEPSFSHLSQMDYFLDSITFLPVAIKFNVHPDTNVLLDIPVEARFSDYRAVNGVQVPFHVQRFLNNVLSLDFQFETAALNTGLSASQLQ